MARPTTQPQPAANTAKVSAAADPQPHDWQTLIRICQLFGVAPVPHADVAGGRCQRAATVAHRAWSVWLLAFVAWSTYESNRRFVRFTPSIVRYLFYAEYAFNWFNSALCVAGAVATSRRLHDGTAEAAIAARLRRLDDDDASADRDALAAYLRRFYAAVLAFGGLLLTILCGFNPSSAAGVLFGIGTLALPNVMVMLALAKYGCLMRMVRLRFDRIAGRLLADGEADAFHNDASTHWRQSSNLFVLEFQTVFASGCRKHATRTTSTPTARLNRLRDVFHELCRSAEALNRRFGALIISQLLSAMFIITGQLYGVYRFVQGASLADGRMSLAYLFTAIWMVTNFTKVALVLHLNGRLQGAVSASQNALCH